jgi:hypothetical protein
VVTGTAWAVPAAAVPAAEELADLFLRAIPSITLLVFLLVSAAIGDENSFKFNWLWY